MLVGFGSANPSGITPITVYGAPSRRIALPSTPGSPASADFQKAWLITTTRAPRDSCSSWVNARPSVGNARIARKKLAVTRAMFTGRASPRSSQLVMPGYATVTAAKLCWTRRMSSKLG